MNYDTILVPTDGSDGIDQVLDHALRLASDHGATVHALYVVDQRLSLAADDDSKDDVSETLHEQGREAVDHVSARGEEAGVAVESVVREGVPDKLVVNYAAEHDVDVVVMGTHGRTGRDRIANLGSVAERVVTNADRPVFVVHIAEE